VLVLLAPLHLKALGLFELRSVRRRSASVSPTGCSPSAVDRRHREKADEEERDRDGQ
jgi:hypothetical protein